MWERRQRKGALICIFVQVTYTPQILKPSCQCRRKFHLWGVCVFFRSPPRTFKKGIREAVVRWPLVLRLWTLIKVGERAQSLLPMHSTLTGRGFTCINVYAEIFRMKQDPGPIRISPIMCGRALCPNVNMHKAPSYACQTQLARGIYECWVHQSPSSCPDTLLKTHGGCHLTHPPVLIN